MKMLLTSGGVTNPRIRDALIDLDIGAALHEHKSKGAIASVVTLNVPREEVRNYGIVVAGRDGRVESFQEKPEPAEARSTLASTGIYIFEPAALEAMGERLKGLVPDSRRFAPSLGQTFLLRKGSVEALHDWHARLAQPPTRLDWHNQRTALLMDLNAALNHLPDDASREALIQVLRAQLPPAPDRGGGHGATAL